jgi:hypothetical protein
MNSREVLREKLYGGPAMSIDLGNPSIIQSSVRFSRMMGYRHQVSNPVVL